MGDKTHGGWGGGGVKKTLVKKIKSKTIGGAEGKKNEKRFKKI